jgi:hypothetical protein
VYNYLMKKYIVMGGWKFFWLFLLYIVVAGALLLLTTGGWGGLGVALIDWPVLIFFLFVVLIATIVRNSRGLKSVNIARGSFWVLIAAQILTLLFNVGDCGDTGGSYSFIQKVLSGFSADVYCSNTPSSYHAITGAWNVTAFLFVAALIYFIYSSFKKPKQIT